MTRSTVTTTLLALIMLTYADMALAVKFRSYSFEMRAEVGKVFQLDLRTLLQSADPGVPIRWTVEYNPKWLKLDEAKSKLSGVPDIRTQELLQVYAVQGTKADTTQIRLSVEEPPGSALHRPQWSSTRFMYVGCVGKVIATDDFRNWVTLEDPGLTLPIPTIDFQIIGAPAWVREIHKPGEHLVTGPSYYLTGVPETPGEYMFTLRALCRGKYADAEVTFFVERCRP